MYDCLLVVVATRVQLIVQLTVLLMKSTTTLSRCSPLTLASKTSSDDTSCPGRSLPQSRALSPRWCQ
jgi:hypothetical protein